MIKNIEKLFESPLPSARSGAFFNAFSYPTKISPESIAVYIAAMTKPGETVLDTFGGSGSTGIAALLCEHPTDKMKQIAEDLGVSPEWGVRNASIYEIGTYGSFAARTITSRLKAKVFKDAVDSFIKKAENLISDYYKATDPDGKEGKIRHVIWSEILLCQACGCEINYFANGVQRNPVKFKKTMVCPKCSMENNIEDMKFAAENYFDSILQTECKRKKRVPVWIYGTTNGYNWDRAANEADQEIIAEIETKPYQSEPKKIEWGELHRSGYHYGITHLHHFYTKRNYIVMDQLWKLTEEYDEHVRNALKLLLLSYNASHCTMMTRVVAKKGSKDFILTGSQSGVLYISKLPVEKNILLGLQRKAKPIYEAFRLLENCKGTVEVHNKTSQNLEEKEKSVRLVFTDPPFGDFIPYAEVNQINELWLENQTNRDEEIIISDSQKKDIDEYRKMLTKVFLEIKRVLSDDAFAIVIFHAAKAQIWEAFECVINDAGLRVQATNILNKEQASFKQTVSEGSVQGDPLLLLGKCNTNSRLNENTQMLRQVINNMAGNAEFNERRVYSLYINECLAKNVRVAYSAKEAYVIMRAMREEIMNGKQH